MELFCIEPSVWLYASLSPPYLCECACVCVCLCASGFQSVLNVLLDFIWAISVFHLFAWNRCFAFIQVYRRALLTVHIALSFHRSGNFIPKVFPELHRQNFVIYLDASRVDIVSKALYNSRFKVAPHSEILCDQTLGGGKASTTFQYVSLPTNSHWMLLLLFANTFDILNHCPKIS